MTTSIWFMFCGGSRTNLGPAVTDTWTDWTSSTQARQVFGDQGPWVRHLALAWHAANVPPGLDVPLPLDPTTEIARCKADGIGDLDRLHGDLIAYWAPLLHLLCFGLGWSRADLGLARWLERGAPTEDPLLRVVDRWWGRERVLDFVAWAATNETVIGFGSRIAETGGYRRFDEAPLPDRYHEQRRKPAWQAVWAGGTDPLHTVGHSAVPVTYPDEGDETPFNPVPHMEGAYAATDPAAVPRMVIVTDTYRAWYALFWHYRPERGGNGRSIRTDLVCKPVGWLGEYRFSTVTGAWFRGHHRWHVLGH